MIEEKRGERKMRRMRKAVLVVTVFSVFLETGLSVAPLGMRTLFAADPYIGDINNDAMVDGVDLASFAND